MIESKMVLAMVDRHKVVDCGVCHCGWIDNKAGLDDCTCFDLTRWNRHREEAVGKEVKALLRQFAKDELIKMHKSWPTFTRDLVSRTHVAGWMQDYIRKFNAT